MALEHFIPEIWADTMLDRWMDQSVLADLVNREYEGNATRGNTVHMTGAMAPTIKDYKDAGRTTTAEAISDIGVDLHIDQEKAFDFYVDDIDRAQAAGGLGAYTDAAADGLVEDANSFIAALLASGGTVLAGEIPTSGDEAFNLIRDARKALNRQHVPFANRVLLVNSEFEGLLLGADSKLTAFNTSGDSAGLREATIGRLLQFRVVTSDAMPEVAAPAFIAFHQRAAAFVAQIDQVEAMRAENKFADRVRGLNVYGGVVVKPEGVQVFAGAIDG